MARLEPTTLGTQFGDQLPALGSLSSMRASIVDGLLACHQRAQTFGLASTTILSSSLESSQGAKTLPLSFGLDMVTADQVFESTALTSATSGWQALPLMTASGNRLALIHEHFALTQQTQSPLFFQTRAANVFLAALLATEGGQGQLHFPRSLVTPHVTLGVGAVGLGTENTEALTMTRALTSRQATSMQSTASFGSDVGSSPMLAYLSFSDANTSRGVTLSSLLLQLRGNSARLWGGDTLTLGTSDGWANTAGACAELGFMSPAGNVLGAEWGPRWLASMAVSHTPLFAALQQSSHGSHSPLTANTIPDLPTAAAGVSQDYTGFFGHLSRPMTDNLTCWTTHLDLELWPSMVSGLNISNPHGSSQEGALVPTSAPSPKAPLVLDTMRTLSVGYPVISHFSASSGKISEVAATAAFVTKALSAVALSRSVSRVLLAITEKMSSCVGGACA